MNSERDSNYPPPLPPSGAALDLEQLRAKAEAATRFDGATIVNSPDRDGNRICGFRFSPPDDEALSVVCHDLRGLLSVAKASLALIERVEELEREKVEDAILIGKPNGGEELQTIMRMHNETIARAEKAEAEREALRTYAHEITKALTNLVGGGSEMFGHKIGEMYTADIPFCIERISDRQRRADERARSALAQKDKTP